MLLTLRGTAEKRHRGYIGERYMKRACTCFQEKTVRPFSTVFKKKIAKQDLKKMAKQTKVYIYKKTNRMRLSSQIVIHIDNNNKKRRNIASTSKMITCIRHNLFTTK